MYSMCVLHSLQALTDKELPFVQWTRRAHKDPAKSDPCHNDVCVVNDRVWVAP